MVDVTMPPTASPRFAPDRPSTPSTRPAMLTGRPRIGSSQASSEMTPSTSEAIALPPPADGATAGGGAAGWYAGPNGPGARGAGGGGGGAACSTGLHVVPSHSQRPASDRTLRGSC